MCLISRLEYGADIINSHGSGCVLVVSAIQLLLVFEFDGLERVHVFDSLQCGPEVVYHITHQNLNVLLCGKEIIVPNKTVKTGRQQKNAPGNHQYIHVHCIYML